MKFKLMVALMVVLATVCIFLPEGSEAGAWGDFKHSLFPKYDCNGKTTSSCSKCCGHDGYATRYDVESGKKTCICKPMEAHQKPKGAYDHLNPGNDWYSAEAYENNPYYTLN